MERRQLTLEQINRKEERDRTSFDRWLNHDYLLKSLPAQGKEQLKLYVNGLLSLIADLESDLNRPFWK